MGLKISTSSITSLILALWLAVAIFISALQYFIHHLPSHIALEQASSQLSSDGIIVATGGQARLSAGLSLLSKNKAPILLLTGVGEGVTKDMIADSLALSPADRAWLSCCIELDFIATDTKGNAMAAKKWVTDNKLSSVILVTAHYHMPRALLEFKSQLVETEIASYAVIPPDLARSHWLTDWPSLRLYGREFVKYQIRKLTILFENHSS